MKLAQVTQGHSTWQMVLHIGHGNIYVVTQPTKHRKFFDLLTDSAKGNQSTINTYAIYSKFYSPAGVLLSYETSS